jgi:RNA polymerase sigma-32 factor
MLFGSRESRAEARGDQPEETVLLGPLTLLTGTDGVPSNTDIARRDFSLDAMLGEDGRMAYVDLLRDNTDSAESRLSREETREVVSNALEEAIGKLNERERYILESRLIADEPLTLQEIGEKYGITRERARQLEANLRKKLAAALTGSHPDADDLTIDV